MLIEAGQTIHDWQTKRQEKALASTFLSQMIATVNDHLNLKKYERSLSDDLQDLGKAVEENGLNIGEVVGQMVMLASGDIVSPEVAEFVFDTIVSEQSILDMERDAARRGLDRDQLIHVFSILIKPEVSKFNK